MTETFPEFLEPTPRRLRVLAWAFAWRYAAYGIAYAIVLTIIEALLHKEFNGSTTLFYGYFFPLMILQVFYHKKRLTDFRLALFFAQGERIRWDKQAFKAMERKQRRQFNKSCYAVLNRFAFRFLLYVVIFSVACLAVIMIVIFGHLINAEIFMAWVASHIIITVIVALFVVNPAMGYCFSYLTFRHVLRKEYEVGKIRLVAAEA